MSLSEKQAREFLLGRFNYERTPGGSRSFTLDRMRRLLSRLGNPQAEIPVVHIAGTKGKGSTAAMAAAMLSASGSRTGLYHSPHLDCIEERMIVDGQFCSADEFVELVELVRPAAEALDKEEMGGAPMGATFFELTTAMAFLYFVRQSVDVVVLEVGLGGRLDSTNVCQPSVSVITNISFDHTKQLGKTLKSIAREKAGIIKPGVPVVSGVIEPEPRGEIEQACIAAGSPLRQLGVDFDFDYRAARDVQDHCSQGQIDFRRFEKLGNTPSTGRPPIRYRDLELRLLGRHQAANAAVALMAVAEFQDRRRPRINAPASEEALRRGLAEVRWPARVEVLSRRPTLILDAAHNLASIHALLSTLEESFTASRRILVFGTTSDKDIRAMLAILMPRFEHVVFTRYVENPRGISPRELDEMASGVPVPRTVCPNPAQAWETASGMVERDDLICITGSFFLAAEMRKQITLRPLNAASQTAALSQ